MSRADDDGTGSVGTDLLGTDPETVRSALANGDPLPGTAGFAGALDGRLVRDVLGRRPLFVADGGDRYARAPDRLDDPAPLPAGSVLDPSDGDPDPRRVWRLPDPDPADPETAVDRVRAALRAVDLPAGCPVAFSGGVDSTVLAAATDGPLYVAGFPDSHDVRAARRTAAAMDRSNDLHVVEIDHDDLRRVVPRVARVTGRTNPMDVSIVAPLWLAAERVAADGHDRLAVGQGADELFGGYAKVANAPDDERVAADTVRGATREVVLGLPEQLSRDVPALRAAGVDPVAPLLHDRVVTAALRLPAERLVDGDRRKVALRRAAADLPGVPSAAVDREKKAVQYGSLVSRELDRIARRAGFKRRMDDHVGQYVRSLLDDS